MKQHSRLSDKIAALAFLVTMQMGFSQNTRGGMLRLHETHVRMRYHVAKFAQESGVPVIADGGGALELLQTLHKIVMGRPLDGPLVTCHEQHHLYHQLSSTTDGVHVYDWKRTWASEPLKEAWVFFWTLVHRNRSGFAICDCYAHCRPQKSPASLETRHSNAALGCKVVMENCWRYAISSCDVGAQNPSLLRDFWRFGSVHADIASDSDGAILVPKVLNRLWGLAFSPCHRIHVCFQNWSQETKASSRLTREATQGDTERVDGRGSSSLRTSTEFPRTPQPPPPSEEAAHLLFPLLNPSS